MLVYTDSPVFHSFSQLVKRLMLSHIDRNSLFLECFLEERKDQFTFRINIRIEQDGMIVWS